MGTKVKVLLDGVPDVEIDEGIFKYVLIKVYADDAEGNEISKLIVRGFLRASWHADIYEEVSSSLAGLSLDTECLGGGRINHQLFEKEIKIYGYSQGYGKANHEDTKKIILSKYPAYQITCSDEGY